MWVDDKPVDDGYEKLFVCVRVCVAIKFSLGNI